MTRLTKEQMEAFLERQEKYDFLRDDFIENIEHVDIFCENCDKCSMVDECPSVDTLGKAGLMLKKLHETFEEIGVDSELHELTSEHNEGLDEIVCGVGCVMPVKTVLYEDGVLCGPMHNFLLFEMSDGRKLLYDVDVAEEKREVNGMMYW